MIYSKLVDTESEFVDPELDSTSIFLSDDTKKLKYFFTGSTTPDYLCFTALKDLQMGLLYCSLSDPDTPVAETLTLDLEYSADGNNWSTFTSNTEYTMTAGSKMYMRGNNTTFSDIESAYVHRFVFTGNVEASGNIMYLFNKETVSNELTTDGCLAGLFYNCSNLKTAPELPATTLTSMCYVYMFAACSNLTTAPELPATTLTSMCYGDMFAGCTSLTTAPKLHATTLSSMCYYEMFASCSSLNSVIMLATSLPEESSCLDNWLADVASSGTIYKDPAMTSLEIDSTSGIPTGWTAVDYTE